MNVLNSILAKAKRFRYELQFAAHRPLYSIRYFRYRTFTMIRHRNFVINLDLCVRLAPKSGCIVECGVWRGGMSAGMADTLPRRIHFLFDSFEGLPPAKEEVDGAAAIAYQRDKDHPAYYDNCRAERSFAEAAMKRSAAREYRLVQGWFAETLPNFVPPLPIAVLRLDGDWYDSTMQCLDALYQYVMPGGLILIDDYYSWEGCSRAIHDFLSKTKSRAQIRQKGFVAYFTKDT